MDRETLIVWKLQQKVAFLYLKKFWTSIKLKKKVMSIDDNPSLFFSISEIFEQFKNTI